MGKISYKNCFYFRRTPDLVFEYATTARERGIEVIIAGAGGAAHLPGLIASKTTLPVLGVPIQSTLNGIDSLLSICQMPKGISVLTLGIGDSGAINAALSAVQILSLKYTKYIDLLNKYRDKQTSEVLENSKIKEYKGF